MVKTGAIRFKLPKYTVTKVKPMVKTVAARGIFSFPSTLLNIPAHLGNILSLARACNTLGAPNKLPVALERVAPHMPSTMAPPQMAISCMIKGFSIRVEASALLANITGKII